MKTRNLFLSLFAFAAVCACNKEEVQGTPEVLDQDAYVAVNIVYPNDDATRASGFEEGTPAENYVSKALFVFLDGSDNVVQVVSKTFENNNDWTSGTDNPEVEKISSAILVLEEQTVMPKSLVVIVNSEIDAALFETNDANTLNKIRQIADAYTGNTSGAFVMSNSVYVKNDEVVDKTAIPAASIKSSANEAKSAPVNVYVERVLAKVTGSAAVDASKSREITPVGKATISYKPVIKGYAIAEAADKSFIVKNLNSSYGFTWTWNDENNYRSYWAESPSLTQTNTYTWANMYDADGAGAETAGMTGGYCLENTTSNKTVLVVAAQLVDVSNDSPLHIVRYLGEVYLYDDYRKEGVKLLSSYPGVTYENLQTVWVGGDKQYEVKLQLKEDAIVTDEQRIEINTLLDGMEHAWEWKDGMTYYYTAVQHLGTDNYAIVRNHVYNVNVTSIAGLGTPVFDEDAVIDPEKPTAVDYYLAAKVNILKWKIVNQDVELEW